MTKCRDNMYFISNLEINEDLCISESKVMGPDGLSYWVLKDNENILNKARDKI